MNMRFFRSEEALHEWLVAQKAERGAVLSIHQLWELSQRWYHNRMSQEYRGRTTQQVLEIFRELELTSEFWRAQ